MTLHAGELSAICPAYPRIPAERERGSSEGVRPILTMRSKRFAWSQGAWIHRSAGPPSRHRQRGGNVIAVGKLSFDDFPC